VSKKLRGYLVDPLIIDNGIFGVFRSLRTAGEHVCGNCKIGYIATVTPIRITLTTEDLADGFTDVVHNGLYWLVPDSHSWSMPDQFIGKTKKDYLEFFPSVPEDDCVPVKIDCCSSNKRAIVRTGDSFKVSRLHD